STAFRGVVPFAAHRGQPPPHAQADEAFRSRRVEECRVSRRSRSARGAMAARRAWLLEARCAVNITDRLLVSPEALFRPVVSALPEGVPLRPCLRRSPAPP